MGNCVDVVRPIATEFLQPQWADVQVMGGLGSAALGDLKTTILMGDTLVVPPTDFSLSTIRSNGSKRDLDLLRLNADPSSLPPLKEMVKGYVGDELVVSAFGVLDASKLRKQTKHPWFLSAVKTLVSDRYAQPADHALTGLEKALFPFSVGIDPETLTTWRLDIGQGDTLPIPHPGTMIINYLTRSISGFRPKDNQDGKTDRLVGTILGNAPLLKSWILDGPGKSQFELARILHTLREPADAPQPLIIGHRAESDRQLCLEPLDFEELISHPAFMLAEHAVKTQRKALAFARWKASTLHRAETSERLVAVWQDKLEPLAASIIHNR